MDLHCSAFGKVFLAFGPRACLERVLGARPAGANPADPDHGRGACNECGRIVKQGYAMDDEEYEEGMRSLAAPVWASGGVLAAVIGVSASAATFAEQRVSDIAVLVLQAAKKLAGRWRTNQRIEPAGARPAGSASFSRAAASGMRHGRAFLACDRGQTLLEFVSACPFFWQF